MIDLQGTRKGSGHLRCRRWLRYSLRGLLALVVVAALPAWWLRLELDNLAAEHDAIVQLEQAGAHVHTMLAEPRWFWYRVPKSLAPHQNRARFVNARRTETPVGPQHMPLIARLTDLRVLQIAGSTISDEDLRFCEGLRKLETLDLALCPRITHTGLAHFLKARGLKRISLHGTAFADECIDTLAGFEHLESLILSSTSVTDGAMPRVLRFKRLGWLGLPRGVTSAGLRRIGELSELSHLYIWLHRGDDVEALALVCRLPKLIDLGIWGDGLTNAGLRLIARAAALEEISIHGGAVDGAGLRTLKKLPRLKHLGLAAGSSGGAADDNGWRGYGDRFERFKAEMAPVEIDVVPARAGERGLHIWDCFDVETAASDD